MQNPRFSPTQPVHPTPRTQPVRVKPRAVRRQWLAWGALAVMLIGLSTLLGMLTGLQAGAKMRQKLELSQSALSLQEQFLLSQEDQAAGRYDFARQRLEHILSQDPNFPGAVEGLAQVMSIMNATATPTPPPPSPTASPTPDLRPIEDLYQQALSLFAQEDWTTTIDTLISLRGADRSYHVAEVDGMLFMALRNRGIAKILQQGDLEGGIYDLALSERFGPLDGNATSARDLARLYMFGNSFWEVAPDKAAYYFGQVAAAAPGLSDSSGWSASARYLASIIQWADQLAAQGKWCEAQAQYEAALSMGGDGSLAAKVEQAALECSPPTDTPALETATPTATLPAVAPSATPEGPTAIPPSLPPVLPSPTFTPPAPETTEAPTPELPTATLPAEPTATNTPELPTPELPTATPEILPTATVPPQGDVPLPLPTP